MNGISSDDYDSISSKKFWTLQDFNGEIFTVPVCVWARVLTLGMLFKDLLDSYVGLENLFLCIL